MNEEATAKRVYRYRIGDFTLVFVLLLACCFGLTGLYIILIVVATAAYDEIAYSVLFSTICFLVASSLFLWIYRDQRSSKNIVLFDNKLQLPMTKGENDDDFLLFADVIDIKIDRDYHDHGPAIICSTQSKPVAYKSMYFNSQVEFKDFHDRLISALNVSD